MVGIAIALYDEAYELIKTLQFEKAEGFRHYKGEFCGTAISLFLTKPAIASKSALRSWLASQEFSHIVLSGFCGGLSEKQKLGEGYFFGEIKSKLPKSKTKKAKEQITSYVLSYPSDCLRLFPVASAYCVQHPLFALEDKEDIFLNHAAEVVDMESFPFLEQYYGLRKKKHPYILKFVGDEWADEKLMEKEKYFRAFFREKKSVTKLKIVLKTGVFSSILLYRRKRFLQRQLKKGLCKFIKGSLEKI